MSIESLIAIISKVDNVEIEADKNLKKYSTMRLAAKGDLITVKSEESLIELLPKLSEANINYRILGWGANQLLPKESINPYLQLDFPYPSDYLDTVHDEYNLPASISLAKLSSHAVKNGLKGWEVFTGIPATLGGAIFMNAGTNLGEIGSLIKEVRLVNKEGKIRTVKIDKSSFSYRKNNFVSQGDVIVGAKLVHFGQSVETTNLIKDYLALRNRTQPLKESTCGCIFKNKKIEDKTFPAGYYIDLIGLRGFTYKDMQVSTKHANFMINLDNSEYDDVCKMIEMIKKELKLHSGIDFETEVKLD